MWRNCLNVYLKAHEQIIELYRTDFCCNISTRIAYKWHHYRISLRISQTGPTQTRQLCIRMHMEDMHIEY